HRERRLFFRQMDKDRDFSQMFDDIGKVSGMVLVTIIHYPLRPSLARAPATGTSPASMLRMRGGDGSRPRRTSLLAKNAHLRVPVIHVHRKVAQMLDHAFQIL